jgi:HNH endonuclease
VTVLEPFAYAASAHQRRHGPSGYRNYQEYKDWLRDEFVFRCVYCLERERWYPNRAGSFSVDHVVPQSEDPTRICDYENLVYACTRCNSARQDVRVIDPTAVALGEHLKVEEDGTIRALSPDGQDLIDLLHLDDVPIVGTRRRYLRILSLAARYPEDAEVRREFLDAFGYPEELPDLSRLKPPGGNTREAGLTGCCHALKQRGELAETY